jgi:hypothetical protein
MYRIKKESSRNILRECLGMVRGLPLNHTEGTLDIEETDNILNHIGQKISQNIEESSERFQDELDVSSMFILSIATLSVVLEEYRDDISSLKEQEEQGKDNPSRLSFLTRTLSNYAISIDLLIRSGLDLQARSQLRSFIELSWFIICFADDDELFEQYSNAQGARASGFWKQNLQQQVITKKLSRIESKLGFEDAFVEKMRASRKRIYSSLSNALHHPYTEVCLGSFSVVDDSLFAENLLGALSEDSKDTIAAFQESCFYFIRYFCALWFDRKKELLIDIEKSRTVRSRFYAFYLAAERMFLAQNHHMNSE